MRHWAFPFLAICIFGAASGSLVGADDCGKAFNALIKRKVQSALDEAGLCAGIKKTLDLKVRKVTLGLDKTTATVEKLEVCLSRATIDVSGQLAVTCKTSKKAVIPASISEKVSFGARIRTSDCGVENVRIDPHGEVGKIAANLIDAKGTAQKKLNQGLKKACAEG